MENLTPSAKRVRAIRAALDISQAELANQLGISQRKISRLETTQELDRATAKLFNHILGISESWLMTGEGEEPDWERLGEIKLDHRIKLLAREVDQRKHENFGRGARLNAEIGFDVPIFESVPSTEGRSMHEEPERIIGSLAIPYPVFQSSSFRRYDKERLGALQAEGDSMAPTISSGDYVVASFDDTYRGDGVYVVQLYDSLLIKRIQRQVGGALLLIHENPSYPNQTVPEMDSDAFRLHGRVIWVSHMLGY